MEHIITKFNTVVSLVCQSMCKNVGKTRTTFVNVTLKHLMDPRSLTRAWLPSVLNLRLSMDIGKQFLAVQTEFF